jgi:alpha-beta hydrolase superfamily lysophospholipase
MTGGSSTLLTCGIAVTDTDSDAHSTSELAAAVSHEGLAPAQSLPSGEFTQTDGYFAASSELIPPEYYEDLQRTEAAREDDETRLFWQQWAPASQETRGVVALMHGYGEHSDRYDHVAGLLARAGYTTVALDARGHGRSSGPRGHVSRYADYILDYAEFIERIRRRFGRTPLFALGHSNGGLIVLRYALCAQANDHITAWAVTSPFCGFPGDIPKTKTLAGKLLSKVWGTLSLATALEASDLSHVDRVVETYVNDPLVFAEATARWFTETLATQREVNERASEITVPILFLLAGDDRIVDAEVAEDIFHRLRSSDRELETFPEMYHEILNEASWTDVADRLVSWFVRHTTTGTGSDDGSNGENGGDA